MHLLSNIKQPKEEMMERKARTMEDALGILKKIAT